MFIDKNVEKQQVVIRMTYDEYFDYCLELEKFKIIMESKFTKEEIAANEILSSMSDKFHKDIDYRKKLGFWR